MRKTGIVCTLGPASDSFEKIKPMVIAGMNIARLNMSHGTHDEHAQKIAILRNLQQKGYDIKIMLDTKGPEVRLGTFKNGKTTLSVGQSFDLVCHEVEGDNTQVSVTYKDLFKYVQKGDLILLNDGLVNLEVLSIENDVVHTVSHNEGVISNRKGLCVPSRNLNIPFLSDVDKKDLLFGIEHNVDMVAASFVQDFDDLEQLRDFLDSNGGKSIKIVSKIETREALLDIDKIIELSDGVMVARGDLGVEIPYEKLPAIQMWLISKIKNANKFSITATEMLESMIENLRPTRAEVTDVANAVFLGSDYVMLSAESAVGVNPPNTISVMAKIIAESEKMLDTRTIEI